MNSTAYIASNLNLAFIHEHADIQVVSGNEVIAKRELDNYLRSQLIKMGPEIIEVVFDSEADLRDKVKKEFDKQELLKMTLELMDPSLSESYRKSISRLIVIELEKQPENYTFLENRLLSTILPKQFNPELAIPFLVSQFPNLSILYNDLEIKSTYFSRFYTTFILQLKMSPEDQAKIDFVLTESGAYGAITKALFEKSLNQYKVAVLKACQLIEKEFPQVTQGLFFDIYKELINDNKLNRKVKEIQISSNNRVSNFITKIQVASNAGHRIVEFPSSHLNTQFVEILYQKGYILKYKYDERNNQGIIKIALKYNSWNNKPAMQFSEGGGHPTLHRYTKTGRIFNAKNNSRVAIVSTSKGIMTKTRAKGLALHATVLCYID